MNRAIPEPGRAKGNGSRHSGDKDSSRRIGDYNPRILASEGRKLISPSAERSGFLSDPLRESPPEIGKADRLNDKRYFQTEGQPFWDF